MVFIAYFNVLRLITVLGAKISKNSYLREFCEQVSQIVFFADLTVLQPVTTVWGKLVTNLISPWVHWTSITNRVFSILHCSWAFYQYIKKNVTKLISPRVLWTSITNRVPSWFDRFTAYYNCMTKNVTNLISPRALCTSITKRVFSGFERFTA